GNTFGKHNKFKAELAVSPRDLRLTESGSNVIVRESPLLTWFMEFDYLRDLTLRVGQYKIPYSRQRVISSGALQLVDRSIANAEFTLDRDIGFDLRSKNLLGLNLLRYYVGVYNGEGRSAYSNGTKHLMYLGRIEILPLGIFKDYSEGDFQRLAKPGLSLGVSYTFANNARAVRVNQGAPRADGGTADHHNIAADVTFKYGGFSFASEFFWRDGDPKPVEDAVDENGNPIPTPLTRQGLGWFAQAGYLLPQRPLEIAGRYGRVQGEGTSTLTDQNEGGAAASYYFARHAFKLQADFFRLWPDRSFEEGEWRFRMQLQVAL
ncbi:MAG: OprO/OprP family phosphate-selective porin, partial [Deltaproteobacteria bacterium]|nr:OprO/OprP family phosphate-selective porin [Deltaproteobacteria bacterium]